MPSSVIPFRDSSLPVVGADRLTARKAYREACKAIAAHVVGEAFSKSCRIPGAGVIGGDDALPIFVAAMRRELRKSGDCFAKTVTPAGAGSPAIRSFL